MHAHGLLLDGVYVEEGKAAVRASAATVLTDVGAQALIDNAKRFAHLELKVAGYFTDGVVAALRATGAAVEKRGDPDADCLYTEVGE